MKGLARSLVVLFLLVSLVPADEVQDPGRTPISNLRVCVIWGTDGDPDERGSKGARFRKN